MLVHDVGENNVYYQISELLFYMYSYRGDSSQPSYPGVHSIKEQAAPKNNAYTFLLLHSSHLAFILYLSHYLTLFSMQYTYSL